MFASSRQRPQRRRMDQIRNTVASEPHPARKDRPSANAPDWASVERSGQCFPRYLYEAAKPDDESRLFVSQNDDTPSYTRRDAITDEGLAHFVAPYTGETITKDDLSQIAFFDRHGIGLGRSVIHMQFAQRAARLDSALGAALGGITTQFSKPGCCELCSDDCRIRVESKSVAKFSD
jgi:hypothetical protein